MKNNIYINISIVIAIILLYILPCSAQNGNTRAKRYDGIYKEQPISLLILPPINKTNNKDAGDYFYTTMNMPLSERGYYVIPPYMAYSLYKNNELYDDEFYFNNDLKEFKEIFDVDAVIITIIHNWEKELNIINVDIEYIIKSTKTNKILFQRRCDLDFSTEKNTGAIGSTGRLFNLIASALNTAVKDCVIAARKANTNVFSDLPYGNLHPDFMKDGKKKVGDAIIKVVLE